MNDARNAMWIAILAAGCGLVSASSASAVTMTIVGTFGTTPSHDFQVDNTPGGAIIFHRDVLEVASTTPDPYSFDLTAGDTINIVFQAPVGHLIQVDLTGTAGYDVDAGGRRMIFRYNELGDGVVVNWGTANGVFSGGTLNGVALDDARGSTIGVEAPFLVGDIRMLPPTVHTFERLTLTGVVSETGFDSNDIEFFEFTFQTSLNSVPAADAGQTISVVAVPPSAGVPEPISATLGLMSLATGRHGG